MGNPIRQILSKHKEPSSWLSYVHKACLKKGDLKAMRFQEILIVVTFDDSFQIRMRRAYHQELFELGRVYAPTVFFDTIGMFDIYCHDQGGKGAIKWHWSGGGSEAFEFHGLFKDTFMPFRNGQVQQSMSSFAPASSLMGQDAAILFDACSDDMPIGHQGYMITGKALGRLPSFFVCEINGLFYFYEDH